MKKLSEFRCFVQTEKGKLFQCKIMPDGGIDHAYGQINWTEVKAPVNQAFLDAANNVLGTAFKLEDFGSESQTKAAGGQR